MNSAKKKSRLTATMADWEGLPQDVLALILKKMKLVEDFIAFGMVCKSWHMAFATNKSSLCRHQTPWLMLPEKKAEDHRRRIFSLPKQNLLAMNLYIPEMSDKRCMGLNYGWALTMSSGEKWEMSLVHPLSRSQIKLPSQTSIAEYDNLPSYVFRRRAALSADPSESPSDFVLMILHSGKYLGYWRPGDTEWTRVEHLNYSCDLTYYKDQFYVITHCNDVWSYKVSSHGPVVARWVVAAGTRFNIKWPYIVGNAGGLIVLSREQRRTNGQICPRLYENGKKYYAVDWVADFQVYELDLINRSSKRIKNIGDKAIFVGYNTSISVDRASRFPGVKSNHIYYTHDCTYPGAKKEEKSGKEGGGVKSNDFYDTDDHNEEYWEGGRKDMGSYDIQNRLTMPFQIEESSSLINPPFWFSPSL